CRKTRRARPRLRATKAHTGQPIRSQDGATVAVTSSAVRSTASTCTASRPSNRSHRGQGSAVVDAAAHPVTSGTSRSSRSIRLLGRTRSSGTSTPRPRLPRRQPAPHQMSQEPDYGYKISEFPHLIVNQARVLDYFAEAAATGPGRIVPDYGI